MKRGEASAVRGIHLRAGGKQKVHQVEAGGARQPRVQRRVGESVPRAGARVRLVPDEQGGSRRLAEVGREVERRPAVTGMRRDELGILRRERGEPRHVTGCGGLEHVERGAAGPQDTDQGRQAAIAGQ